MCREFPRSFFLLLFLVLHIFTYLNNNATVLKVSLALKTPVANTLCRDGKFKRSASINSQLSECKFQFEFDCKCQNAFRMNSRKTLSALHPGLIFSNHQPRSSVAQSSRVASIPAVFGKFFNFLAEIFPSKLSNDSSRGYLRDESHTDQPKTIVPLELGALHTIRCSLDLFISYTDFLLDLFSMPIVDASPIVEKVSIFPEQVPSPVRISAGLTKTQAYSSTPIATTMTTVVTLADERNSTITIGNSTVPTLVTVPVPAPENVVLPGASYNFFSITANASSYVLGALIPLTIGGLPFIRGAQFLEAFKCQLDIINGDPEILPNSYITYLIADSTVAVSTSTKQGLNIQNQPISMIVGPNEDNQALSLGQLYNPIALPFVSYGASSENLSNSTKYPSFFRTIPPAGAQAEAMIETMLLFGWTYVAALFTSDEYGSSGLSSVTNEASVNGIELICVDSIQPGSIAGLSNFSTCVANSGASIVLLWSMRN